MLLSYIAKLRFDELKIDRAFVNGMESNVKQQKIVNAITLMAQGMDKSIVAEGVEICEQLAYAKEKKIDTIQGYLYSKPLPADDFVNYVTSSMSKLENE
ncbi:EAL domain-containing protein [Catenovulum sp. SM1970]|uniref:EAL domain-containing protein n=1 Tax=Marinifaba aquimaris TaxID=2741323 RepID=UPI0015717FB5|nr:EAL domain-containing protein [Marinifaba aquimaris]NTS78828.1 EAL domain-containing protein [Marinifaba aquimaris]